MPSWSVHWVLIWLNLSTSSPVCLPLCLQLSGLTAQGSDWLTSARLACVFMHAGLIISLWPWIYPALPTFTPFLSFIFIPCLVSRQRPSSSPRPTTSLWFFLSCPLHSFFAAASCFLNVTYSHIMRRDYRDTHREGLSKYEPIRWKTVSFDSMM